MKGTIAWFAENHVAANLLMLFLLVAGALTAASINLEVFPDTSLDKISVSVVYPGASPAEVEEAVVRRIEEKIAGIAGIQRIDAKAQEGYGSVIIEIVKGWDQKQLLDEIKGEVDRLTTLPNEAEKPVVREVVRRSQVINLALYGDVSEATLKYWAQRLRDDITNLPGVTQAEVAAVRNDEIHIEISEAVLRRYGLSLGTVAEQVARSSLDLPAGSVKTTGGEVLVRSKGRRYTADDFKEIAMITRPDGSQITLGRIATVRDGFDDQDLFARFQGKPAAIINVYRVADQNALTIANAVKRFMTEVQSTLPHGVHLDLFADYSKLLRSRLDLLLKNMTIGLCLVILLLGLFLNLRLSFWVTIGIPISFAAGLFLLPSLDVSINMVSLFAFIMVLGIVVDDAIIVGENVFRHAEKGTKPLKAAVEGTLEVGRPVIFSVLTTIMAFWPLLLAGGTMGKFMRNLPIVVMLVLAGSLVESLFILPAHLARSKAVRSHKDTHQIKQGLMARGLRWVIDKPYARVLRFTLKWRYATMAMAITILLCTLGLWLGGHVKYTFFPKVESDSMEALVTMPTGTPVERTQEVVAMLEQAARQILTEQDRLRSQDAPPLMQYSMALVGAHYGRHGRSNGSGSHLAQVWIQLIEGEKRDVSSIHLSKLWRQATGPIKDAQSVNFSSTLHSMGNAIEVDLSMNNHEMLLAAAEQFKAELRRYPGVSDIGDSYLPGKAEMQFKLKPAAAQLGITLNDLAHQVRHALHGAEALRFQRDQDEVKVLVRYPQSERASLNHVEQMPIRTRNGGEVLFHAIAEVEIQQGYAIIQRAQRQRVITVSADVDEKIANADEIRAELETVVLPQLQSRFSGLRYSMEGEGRSQRESMSDVYRGFLVALFCIYALLGVPFRSFAQPLVVMFAIPFGIVGAVWGHILMGFNLSAISLFGIVGLSGVVVNDSLVLVHRANAFRDNGFSATEAIRQAGAIRFRAIILTSITTFAGLTPMLLERSLQARFLVPMAISLGFGVLFATAITLILIPCGYLILYDIQRLLGLQPRPAINSISQ